MSVKIGSGANEFAKAKGLDLNKLNESQLKKLDTNKDGTISKSEAEKALKIADVNNDGYVEGSEVEKFTKLLDTNFNSKLGVSAEVVDLASKLGPEKTEKLVKFFESITGGDPEATKRALAGVSKSKDLFGVANKFLKAADAFDSGKTREGVSYFLEGAADAWNAMPEGFRQKVMDRFGKWLSKVPKFGGFASLIGDMEKIGATPGLMKMFAGALRGDGKAIEGGFKDILSALKDADTATKGKITAKLVGAFGGILPKSVLAKIAAKKVPVVSLFPAAWDTIAAGYYAISGDGKEAAKRLASAGSGVASTIPGWGTAASTAIDLGLLTYDIVDAFSQLSNTQIGENPFGG